MSRSLSVLAASSLFAENTDQVWLAMLTFQHASLPSPIYIVNNNEDIVSNGNTFIGLPFSLVLPAETQDELGSVEIVVSNVDQTIVNLLRSISDPPTVVIQVALASSPSTIEIQLDGLVLRDTEYDDHEVRGTLRFEDILSEPICEIQTPDRFPALF